MQTEIYKTGNSIKKYLKTLPTQNPPHFHCHSWQGNSIGKNPLCCNGSINWQTEMAAAIWFSAPTLPAVIYISPLWGLIYDIYSWNSSRQSFNCDPTGRTTPPHTKIWLPSPTHKKLQFNNFSHTCDDNGPSLGQLGVPTQN